MFVGSKLFEKALDFLSKRNNILSNNIANADTPNFKASDLSFKDELERVLKKNENCENDFHLKTSDEHHISDCKNKEEKAKVITENTYQNNNGNSVDIEAQMIEISKNSMYYDVIAKKVAGKYNKVKNLFKE